MPGTEDLVLYDAICVQFKHSPQSNLLGKKQQFGIRQIWIGILNLQINGCQALDKFYYLSISVSIWHINQHSIFYIKSPWKVVMSIHNFDIQGSFEACYSRIRKGFLNLLLQVSIHFSSFSLSYLYPSSPPPCHSFYFPFLLLPPCFHIKLLLIIFSG